MLVLQCSKRDVEGAFSFFSTTGFLPRPSACGLVDIHREGKEQQLINSSRGGNRVCVCERGGGGKLPLMLERDDV